EAAAAIRVVDGNSRAGVGDEGDVRGRAPSGALGNHPLLVGGLALIRADAAAAAAPTGLALVFTMAVQKQRSTADSHHVWRTRRVAGNSAAVARGGDKRDAVVPARCQ